MIAVRRNLASSLWCLLVLLTLLLAMPLAVRAQKSEPSTATAVAQNESQVSGKELAKESAEAEKDETAQFKHSAPVKFIAKITGLSLENTYWLCVVVNFAIVAGLIFQFARKKLPSTFRNRTASIQKAMSDARAASEDANRRLADIESRLSKLDSEIGQIRSHAETEAAAEEERIKAATADDVRKVVESAEQEIAAAAKAARRDLRAYAADLVTSLAEKQIQVDTKTDQALVHGFAQKLASDGTQKGAR